MPGDIRSFTDLEAWRVAHQLVLVTYEITKRFPKGEQFGIVSQMRRAALSVSSNIAEGFSRRTAIHKQQMYCIAEGSIIELQNQLLVARDIGYIDHVTFQRVAEQTVVVHKLVCGLMKSAADRVLKVRSD